MGSALAVFVILTASHIPANAGVAYDGISSAIFRRMDAKYPEIPPDCLAKCDGLDTVAKSMKAKMAELDAKYPEISPEDVDNMVAALTEREVWLFGQLCLHKSAMQCVADNWDVCSGVEDSRVADSQSGIDALRVALRRADCFCNTCPNSLRSFAKFGAELMAVWMDPPENPKDALTDRLVQAECSMHDGIICWRKNPIECPESTLSEVGLDIRATLNNTTALKTRCEEKGYPLSAVEEVPGPHV